MSQPQRRLSDVQVWTAESYDRNVRFVSDLAGGVMEWFAPRAGERVLDLGCGDGVLTQRLAAAGCHAVGVDTADDFIAAARARGLDARAMDGHALGFDAEFDGVFSNAALHWMTRPEAVVDGVWRALKPGGRFVAEFGGHGNVAALVTAMVAVAKARGGDVALASPWYFPTPDEYRALLEARGFTVARIGLFPRPTPLPTGLQGWLMVFRQPFFAQFGADAGAALAEVEELLSHSMRDRAGNWTADYIRLRMHAEKPAA